MIGVGAHLLGEVPGHRVDREGLALGRVPVGEQVHLLELVEVGLGPLLVPARNEVGRVDLFDHVRGALGQLGAVRVADGIGPEPAHQVEGILLGPHLGRKGDASA